MKCRVCGGTGTSNTCVNGTFKPCTFCDGTGEYEPFDADVELDKLYPTEQTNEEWFASLPTTEKSSFLAKMVTEAIKEHGKCGATRCESSIWWDEWLKQLHPNE